MHRIEYRNDHASISIKATARIRKILFLRLITQKNIYNRFYTKDDTLMYLNHFSRIYEVFGK